MKEIGAGRLAWVKRMVVWFVVGTLGLALAACSGDQLLAAYLATNHEALERPAATTPHPAQFVVQPGSTARVIAENLQNAGLINDARLFEAYVRVNGLAGDLQAGAYTLSPSMTPVEIAEKLQHAVAPNMSVTIPEGWRLEQTADSLAAASTLDGAEYRRLASDPGWRPTIDDGSSTPNAYGFLDSRPEGATLEGYLYPDTYQLLKERATAQDLIGRQLDNFARLAAPAFEQAAADGDTKLSLHEVVTLASIVEREAVLDEERPIIAGVYLNRLAKKMKLDADPTVQYAMGYQAATGQWWKAPVSLEEYSQVESPYNTYLHEGLPPGPIASPGIASIRAVLYPAKHDYVYFVALPDGSGRHAFSRTYEEHLENVRRYRGQ
jgi:peptidoglycan lytic transglycosylase G